MLGEFWTILDNRQHNYIFALVALFVINAMSEFFSLGAVCALAMSIFESDNTVAPAQLLVHPVIHFSGYDRYWLSGAVLAAFFVKGCVGVGTNWLRAKVVHSLEAQLSERLLSNYLSRRWPFFLANDSSVLVSQVTNNCSYFVNTLLNNVAVFAAEFFVCTALIMGVALINPPAMLILMAMVFGLVVALNGVLKRQMYRLGRDYWQARVRASVTAETALRGAKEVLLYGCQSVFCERLHRDLQIEGRAGSTAMALSDSPRQIIEFCAVATFMGFLVFQVFVGYSMSAVGMMASVFMAAAFRLLPATSRLSSTAASISHIQPAFEMLRSDLKRSISAPVLTDNLEFFDRIELQDIGYLYPGCDAPALTHVAMTIPFGSTTAIVGRSGAGKSTLVELLVGLLEATEGRILVDGNRLNALNKSSWQKKIGYVPQHPFLCNDTITANIAFGVPVEDIDMELVRRAANVAGIADFIENQMPHGYNAVVGDSGIKLSGGQRKRIAVARALYRQPAVLVLDEATSALDEGDDYRVREAISNLASHMTLIIITHRLESVVSCDQIVVLDKGQLVQTGNFDQLSRDNGPFRVLLRYAEDAGLYQTLEEVQGLRSSAINKSRPTTG